MTLSYQIVVGSWAIFQNACPGSPAPKWSLHLGHTEGRTRRL